MKRINLSLLVFLLCFMLAIQFTSAQSSNTYYIATWGNDNNPGTIDQPWKTLQKGAQKAKAGDTVNVRGGVYYADGVNFGNDGRENAPITFQSYPGETAIIDGSRGWNTMLVIWGDYYIIRNFEIRNSKRTAISMLGGKYVRIEGNNIHNAERGAIYGDGDSAFITLNGNKIHHNVRMNDQFQYGHWGGWPSAIVLSPRNDVIINNEIYENWGEGIGVYGRNHYIAGNTLHDNYSVEIYVNNTENVTVEKNFMYSLDLAPYRRDFGNETAPAAGITIANENSGIAINNVKILNNIIIGKRIWGISQWRGSAGMSSGLRNVTIANNTIVVHGVNGVMHIDENNHSGAIIANNIMYQRNNNKPVTFFRKTNGIVFGNNNRMGGNGWKAGGGDGAAVTDVNADPGLMNIWGNSPADFHLSGQSPVINKGMFINGANVDFYGSQRVGSFDIGAVENGSSGGGGNNPPPTAVPPTQPPSGGTAATLVAPENNTTLVNPNWAVFQWERVPNVENYDIVMVRSNNNQEVFRLRAVCTGTMCYKNAAAADQWDNLPNNTNLKWMVVAINDQGQSANSAARNIMTDFPGGGNGGGGNDGGDDGGNNGNGGPTLRNPADDSSHSDPRKMIFQWNRLSDIEQYDLVVNNKNGNEVFRLRAICTGNMCSKNPSSDPDWRLNAKDRYEWFIVAVKSNGDRMRSASRWFKTDFLPQTIQANEPAIDTGVQNRSISLGGSHESQVITFSWRHDERVQQYRLTVIGPNDKKLVHKWTPARDLCSGNTCYQNVTVAKDGQYTWFIKARRPGVKKTVRTERQSLRVGMDTINAPSLMGPAVDTVYTNPKKIRFAWSHVPGVNRYTIVVTDAQGVPVFSTETTCQANPCKLKGSKSENWALPSGQRLNWYVTAVDKQGNRASSAPMSIVTDFMPGTIALGEPAVSGRVPRGEVVFTWQRDPRIKKYRLTVVSPDNKKLVQEWVHADQICSVTTCAQVLTLRDKGQYRWFVSGKRNFVTTTVRSEKHRFRLVKAQ